MSLWLRSDHRSSFSFNPPASSFCAIPNITQRTTFFRSCFGSREVRNVELQIELVSRPCKKDGTLGYLIGPSGHTHAPIDYHTFIEL